MRTLRKKEEIYLAVHHRRIERNMLGIKLKDNIPNTVMREKTKIPDTVKRICTLKRKWAVQVSKIKDNRWIKRLMEWTPREGSLGRGRPKFGKEKKDRELNGGRWGRSRNRKLKFSI